MKLLLDQNLSPRLVAQLEARFPSSAHVRDLGLSTADDLVIWEHAKASGFTIVSKDADFHQRSFLHGHPPRVIWVRAGNCSTADVLRILLEGRVEIEGFVTHSDASFLILP